MAAWSKQVGTVLIGGYLVGACFSSPSCDLDLDLFPALDAGEITFPDANASCPNDLDTSSCNPTAQTGCNAGEKCTWIQDSLTDCDYVGCAPDGTIPLGGACGTPPEWSGGYDGCVKGTACADGECRQVCDNNGGTPACDAMHVCAIHEDLFDSGFSVIAGVCDVGCDPLTQELLSGTGVAACGSTTLDAPEKGCYGYDSFGCYDVPADVGTTHTDRTLPASNISAQPLIGGCSPGFIPFLSESTGSTRTLCTGLCAALETDNTPAHAGNSKGDATALGKLPDKLAAETGDATCDIGKKGSDPTSACRFIWPYLLQDDGTLPSPFKQSPYRDTLGVCIALDHYFYDANGDSVPETPYPDCSTLPPNSDATPGDFDDASDFQCQNIDHTPSPQNPGRLRRTALVNARIPTSVAPVIARHDLR